jgi:pyrroline-5-carboxylate reductase
MQPKDTIAILGAGTIGRAMALGLTRTGGHAPGDLLLTRRRPERLEMLAREGFATLADNREAVRRAGLVIVAVEPQQLDPLLREIASALEPGRHTLISVVSGVTLEDLSRQLPAGLATVRAMPNTAISLGESMTCLCADPAADAALECARALFESVGTVLVVEEELMTPATALGACGVAFFLRAVRAASQGGIEIGFHPEEALRMAAQTALGAAALVLRQGGHPEQAIDSVTTPRGCTIAGLNGMEHLGFSSALIRGLVISAEKADLLYQRARAGRH